MRLAEFDYALPAGADRPAPGAASAPRAACCTWTRPAGAIEDLAFADLPALVDARDVLVFNDTRVIKARLAGAKASGGRIEVFVERVTGAREALALIRASHHPREAGARLIVGDGARVDGARPRGGPLPRAFRRATCTRCSSATARCRCRPTSRTRPTREDAERYQTVYARAARRGGGADRGPAFRRSRCCERSRRSGARIAHRHAARRRRHLPAGAHREHRGAPHAQRALRDPAATTHGRRSRAAARGRRGHHHAARAGERGAGSGARWRGETDLFITPGFQFRVVDGCSPTSTCRGRRLLMLVSAFAGMENIRRAYAPRDRAALPLLHLRRRDADRARDA